MVSKSAQHISGGLHLHTYPIRIAVLGACLLMACMVTNPAQAADKVGTSTPVSDSTSQTRASERSASTSPIEKVGKLVERFELSNGMRVLVIPNSIVPAVTHMVWYDFGAADDPVAKSGLAHFFEHMMFRGTEAVKAGEFSRIIARIGGEDNAFTSQDYTAYYQKVAKSYLPMVMRLESDRMKNLQLDDGEVVRERQVILEERDQVIGSNVERLFGEQMRNTLFMHHPYKEPIIGWEHEIETLNKHDLDHFYKAYYHPANAILVVGGDITAEELRPLAEQYYGSIQPGTPIVRPEWNEPPHYAAKRLTMQHKLARQPMWRREYVAPSHRYGQTEHSFPLLLLSYILGSDNTGVFYKELVEKRKLVTSVDVFYSGGYRGPGVFTVRFSPVPGAEMKQVETLIDSMIADVIEKGVNHEDMERSKRLLKAMTIYSREGITTLTNFVGMLEITGIGLEYLTEWEERVDGITMQSLQDAARYTLDTKRSVTGILLPESTSQQEGEDDA